MYAIYMSKEIKTGDISIGDVITIKDRPCKVYDTKTKGVIIKVNCIDIFTDEEVEFTQSIKKIIVVPKVIIKAYTLTEVYITGYITLLSEDGSQIRDDIKVSDELKYKFRELLDSKKKVTVIVVICMNMQKLMDYSVT
jgi:translation elongation factor P/translation initiation factor 5A